MKLISMTTFVLEQSKKIMNCELTHLESHHQISNYANFIKQPLKLEIFVPCVYGKPFTDFQLEILNSDDAVPELRKAYEQAKEKVLFEGISVQNSKEWIEFYGAIRVYIETDIKEKMFSHVFREEYPKHKTIEDLTKYDLTLTSNAIKQLGL